MNMLMLTLAGVLVNAPAEDAEGQPTERLQFEGLRIEGQATLPTDFFNFTKERDDAQSVLENHLDIQFHEYNPLGY